MTVFFGGDKAPAQGTVTMCVRVADEAAAKAILDNSQAYLVAMQHSGIFTGCGLSVCICVCVCVCVRAGVCVCV